MISTSAYGMEVLFTSQVFGLVVLRQGDERVKVCVVTFFDRYGQPTSASKDSMRNAIMADILEQQVVKVPMGQRLQNVPPNLLNTLHYHSKEWEHNVKRYSNDLDRLILDVPENRL